VNLLLLGGMSPHNKPWIYEVEQALAPLFRHTLVHEYAHWSDPKKPMDINHEVAAVSEKLDHFGRYVIFAKSAGTLVTLKGMAVQALHPSGCLFAGLPLSLIREEHADASALMRFNDVPTIIVQHEADPVGSFAAVKSYLLETPSNYRLIETPGTTHDYREFDVFKDLAAGLV